MLKIASNLLFSVVTSFHYFNEKKISQHKIYFDNNMKSKFITGNYPLHEKIKTLLVSSNSFANEGIIPSKFSCDGINVNPSLSIKNIPMETKSLVLIVEDPDAPLRTWIHWLVWNIPPAKLIRENSIPGEEGMNDFQKQHYGGPCPPSGNHRYFFKVYALDDLLYLNHSVTKREVEIAMNNHILAFGELIGLYKRTSK